MERWWRRPSGSRAISPTGCSSACRDPAAGGRRRLHRRRRRHGAGAGRRRDRRRADLVGRRSLAGPARRRDRGPPARRPAHARSGQLPWALTHDAAAQRGRRAAARPLAERVGLAPRGAPRGRGRVLGHALGAPSSCATASRRPASSTAIRGRRRRPRRAGIRAVYTPAIFDVPGAGPGSIWEALLADACALFDATAGKHGSSSSASVPTPPTRCRRRGCGPSRPRHGPQRVAADPPVRDGGRVPGRAGALRHERAGAAGRGGPRRPGAGRARGLARRCRPVAAGRARCGRGALPRVQREARLGHRPVAGAARPRGAGRAGHRRPGLQRRPPSVGRDAAGAAAGPRHGRRPGRR